MRGFLINKNLSLHYWLKKRIGKRGAFWWQTPLRKLFLSLGENR
jgi:hypothetical protein